MYEEPITDHWSVTVSDSIIEQYKDSTNWKACLKAVIDKISLLETSAWNLATVMDFNQTIKVDSPSGNRLDFVCSLVNLERNTEETDDSLFERFSIRIQSDAAGTGDFIITLVKRKSSDPTPVIFDEIDCVYFVYTPNGRQLTRAYVKSNSPTGVLGLPGAALKTGDGKFIVDAQGKRILAVADDSNIGNITSYLIGEDSIFILDEEMGIKIFDEAFLNG